MKPDCEHIESNGKGLTLMTWSLQGAPVPDYVRDETQKAFERLSECMIDDEHLLYVRDLPGSGIQGKYPSGHSHNRSESMITVPAWDTPIEPVVATINHELHHLARWQNEGFGTTLGGVILSEGIATYYEELVSGWTPPWAKVAPTKDTVADAQLGWLGDYSHAEWFFGAKYPKWTGYTIGYLLAREIFKDGFDAPYSVAVKPDEVEKMLTNINE